MEEVEISFHIPSLHECQKCKISERQEKGHHCDWCNLANQQTNSQSSKKPSANNANDKENKDRTTTDKACHASENVQVLKVISKLPSAI